MNPRDPNAIASYWGVDPTLVPPEDDAAVAQYWSGEPVNAAAPYQPNPGAAGYNPNHAAAGPAAGALLKGGPPVAKESQGALSKAFSSPDPLFQNPFATQQQPIDIGDIDSPPDAVDIGDIDSPAGAVDMGEIDAPQSIRQPTSFTRGPTSQVPMRGGPANPDPYGIGAAQKAQLAAFDDRMAAMRRGAAAEQNRAVIGAEHAKNLARMQEEDAAIARSEQEYATRHFNEQMAEVGRQLDDVKARKVDPLKDFKESPALGVFAVVGGAISGFYQGLTGGQQNEFIVNLNRQIDRGVAEQERQIRDEKFTIGEGINMLHQQRQAQKDDALADAQMRNLVYEAAKNELAAEADRVGTDIARANADAAISQVAQAQAALQEQIARQKQAQALASANAAHAHSKEVQKAIFEQYEKNLASGMAPGQAVDWARHLIGLVYAPGVPGNPRPEWDESHAGMTKEQRGKVAMEHAEAQHSSDEFNSQVDSLKRHPAIGKLGLTTGALSHLGQRIAPESTAVDQDLKMINTMILQAVGKVAKDADGKPNKAMIEKLEERFEIHPTDTREIALQKLEGARDAVNALARQQGASGAPAPGAQRDIAAKLGAKPVGR